MQVGFRKKFMGFSGGSDDEESGCNARDPSLISGLGRSPGVVNGNPLVFLPGKSHGQRSLLDYNPWGCKQSDTTEQLTLLLLQENYVRILQTFTYMIHS